MVGRFLALCGWLAMQVSRPFGRTPLRRWPAAPAIVLGVALLALAAVPLVVPQLDPQPRDTGVQEIFDGVVSDPDAWVRLRGRVVPLGQSPTGQRGDFALLVDQDERLRAIVLEGDEPFEAAASTAVTGRLRSAVVTVEEELPQEARVAGTPPTTHPSSVLAADAVAKPPRQVWWALGLPPALLGGLLLTGARTGYPLFRTTREIDVLAAPLGTGERVPAAYGGRIGPNRRELVDPGGALLLVRPGPAGNLLTAQPLAEGGGLAPAPVTIGGSWTSGRVGDVVSVSETLPALLIRSELVDAIFMFARTAERDRVAALVAVER